jgi:uncharacterized protein
MRKSFMMMAALLLAWLQAAECSTQELSRYAGSYRLDENQFVWVAVSGEGLIFGESEEGRGGTLVPRSETLFVSGPALGVSEPIDVWASFVKDASDEVQALKWRRGSRPERLAPKVALREEEVRFKNGDVTLAGTLILPPTKGPHPALVLITGSGPALRDQFGGFPHLFAAMGIATLIYDKRGCGASTGSYHDSLAIEDLAADALAGVEYLSARADIDGSQIGLNGASQGGWVAPYVAARSAKVSFLVVTSASGMTTWENGLYEMENDLRLEGYPESDIAKAREINNTFNEMLLQHGEGWAKLRSALESVRSEAWFRMARVPESLPETPEPANLRWVERERKTFFDPLPSWQRIKAPVLVVNGELDRNVPSRESLAKIEAALKKAGNKDYTIKLYPNADHQLWAIEKLGQRDGRSRQVGAYDARMEWLLAHVKIAR